MNIQPVQKNTVQKPQQNGQEGAMKQNMKSTDDPGRTLGIVGFVFAFIGLSIIGIILSAVGYHKSKTAGFKNGLALAGIWLNATFLIIIPILAAITIVSYAGVTARANASRAESNALSVQTTAEAYRADKGNYPDETSDFTSGSILIPLPSGVTVLSRLQGLDKSNGTTSTRYQYTGEFGNATGGKIEYWDFTTDNISSKVIYIGDATKYSQFKNLK
ncbi:MAG: hypothetical protein WCP11_00060 [Candidatus Saccharibacteria bacterium]